jgi:hypothetical protein
MEKDYTNPTTYGQEPAHQAEVPQSAQPRRRSGWPVAIIFALSGITMMLYPLYAHVLWSAGVFGEIIAFTGFIFVLLATAGASEEIFNRSTVEQEQRNFLKEINDGTGTDPNK